LGGDDQPDRRAAFAVSDDNLYGESPPPVTAVVGWAGAEAGAATGGGVYIFPMNASETAAAGYSRSLKNLARRLLHHSHKSASATP